MAPKGVDDGVMVGTYIEMIAWFLEEIDPSVEVAHDDHRFDLSLNVILKHGEWSKIWIIFVDPRGLWGNVTNNEGQGRELDNEVEVICAILDMEK